MLTITFKGLDDAIKKIESSVIVSQGTLRKIAEIIRDDIKNNRIGKGITVSGEAMSPLKPATVKRKGNNRLLIDKGILQASIVVRNDGKGYNVEVVGVRKRIAVFLQRGTDKMDAREFMGVSKEAEKLIDELIKKEIKSKK